MGIDYNAYLGPYVEVTTEIVRRDVDHCKKPDICPNSKQMFCPECGLEVSKRHTSEEREIVEFDTSDLNDNLFNNAGMSYPPIYERNGRKFRNYCFMPNKKGYGRMLDNEEEQVVELNTLNLQSEVSGFVMEFQPQIKILEKAYGYCKLKWGLIRWCS